MCVKSDYNMSDTKIPENLYSLRCEKYILGSIIFDDRLCKLSMPDLSEEDFCFKTSKYVFKAIYSLYSKDKNVSCYNVCDALHEDKSDDQMYKTRLEEIGGDGVVKELIVHCGLGAEFTDQKKKLLYLSAKRKMYKGLTTAVDFVKLSSEDLPVEDLVAKTQDMIFADTVLPKGGHYLLSDLLSLKNEDSVINKILKRIERTRAGDIDPLRGISSGYPEVDEISGGFGAGDLIIIAGRPAMGKTGFALNIAENLLKMNKNVCFFSLEMSAEELVYRMLSSEAGVSTTALHTGNITDEEEQNIRFIIKKFDDKNLIIVDGTNLTVQGLKSMSKQFKLAYEIDIIIVDYIQLMCSNRFYGNRHAEMSEVSRGLKETARALKLPVIALSQLSRKVEDRDSHVPVMSDLKESGGLEQDADSIYMLYRPDYYKHALSAEDKLKVEVAMGDDLSDNESTCEIIVCKNRHGATGKAVLKFIKNLVKFKSSTDSEKVVHGNITALVQLNGVPELW